jgi:two-component system sensor histidine kinase ChvG
MLWPFRSLVGKLVLLAAVFVTVPIILYREFSSADREKQQLLLKSVQTQGHMITTALVPVLHQSDPSTMLALSDELARYARDGTAIKVLYRPADVGSAEGFFFIASAPTVPPAYLEHERERLIELGLLTKLASTCAGNWPLSMRYTNPDGAEEVLTSITPVNTPVGCWAVVTSQRLESLLATSVGQPYWMTLEVRIAAAIYVTMALLTSLIFLSIWRSIHRFRRLAKDIRVGAAGDDSFVVRNRVPELTSVAAEFDRMIKTLHDSAQSLRRAAEDNAHAFKTPIAIIRQSIEPLRRIVAGDSGRGRRAVEVIEQSVDRLDDLVSYARWMDETTAELLDPPRRRVDLSNLCQRLMTAYANVASARRLRLEARLDHSVMVRGSEELLETVIENVMDNAISFSPPQSAIKVALRRADRSVEFSVVDQGPGIDPANTGRVFERYYSDRKRQREPDSQAFTPANQDLKHLGIGLWIVRRNVEAIGGTVLAENDPAGGLTLRIRLPLAA